MNKKLKKLVKMLKMYNEDHPECHNYAYFLLYDDGSGHIGFNPGNYDHAEMDLDEFFKIYSNKMERLP